MTTSSLLLSHDANGSPAFAPNVSNLLQRILLTQNTATAQYTLPTDAENYLVCFSYYAGANVWVDWSGSAATVPASSSWESSTSEQTPAQRTLPGGSSFSMITSDSTPGAVGVSIYAKP